MVGQPINLNKRGGKHGQSHQSRTLLSSNG